MQETPKGALEAWMHLLETRMGGRSFMRQDLDEVRAVAKKMGLLTPRCPVVLVGGTNGKGSTALLMESIYSEAGYRTGIYTSPHLISFNERIRVCGRLVEDHWIVRAFDAIEIGRGEIELSWFEMVTLASLWIFKCFPLDILIFEVGLGGRLDATNILDATLAIVTGISYDHEAILGHTLEEIGREKAGILRESQPFIFGDKEIPKNILKEVQRLNVPFYAAHQDFHYSVSKEAFHFEWKENHLHFPMINCHPRSVALALMATYCLNDRLELTDKERLSGVLNFKIPGRFQMFEKPRTTIVDCAHNPEASAYLAKRVAELHPEGKVHVVFSALADKDALQMIKPFKAYSDFWYPCLLSEKRAMTDTRLQEVFKSSEIKTNLCYNDPILAYQAAISHAKPEDLIIVYGSFALAGPVIHFLSSQDW